MSVAIKLENDISVELESGDIIISGLHNFTPEKQKQTYDGYVQILPEIEKRLVNVGMSIIRKAGGVVRPDGAGLTFNYAKKPETEQEVQSAFKLAQEAENAFWDIRPLIVRTIDLFPIRGRMIKARKVFEKISIIWPGDISVDEKKEAEKSIKAFSLSLADFGGDVRGAEV